MASDSIAVGWRLSSVSGWGVLGLNLVLQLRRMGRNPVLYLAPHRLDVDAEVARLLQPVMARQAHLQGLLDKIGLLEFDFPVLHALRNGFEPPLDDQVARGSKNIGLLAFEDTDIGPAAVARARTYDLMVFSSEWNRRIAHARGIVHSYVLYQGVDPGLFHPRPHVAPRYPGRFVVYSAGKLEYRKAQDVVIAAFRAFHARHPEALLMLAWGNQWPGVMRTIARSHHVEGMPDIAPDGTLRIAPWLVRNGLPEGSFVDLGMPPNRAMPEHLAAADVALFPNRCEPATNLMAMEAMACGVPAILATNTGQLDLAGAHCLTLTHQLPVAPYEPYRGTDGWGEPDLDETIEALESAYRNAETRARLGAAGAAFMRRFEWPSLIADFVRRLDALSADHATG